MIYDPDKKNLPDGFGVSKERLNRLIQDNIQGSLEDCLDRICNSSLPPNEIYLLLLELGMRIVMAEAGEHAIALTEYRKLFNAD